MIHIFKILVVFFLFFFCSVQNNRRMIASLLPTQIGVGWGGRFNIAHARCKEEGRGPRAAPPEPLKHLPSRCCTSRAVAAPPVPLLHLPSRCCTSRAVAVPPVSSKHFAANTAPMGWEWNSSFRHRTPPGVLENFKRFGRCNSSFRQLEHLPAY
jgi:hypothetical protein